jgi:hypothetical protein
MPADEARRRRPHPTSAARRRALWAAAILRVRR